MKSQSQVYKLFLIVVPVICIWYVSLFITIWLWYPAGLSSDVWLSHVLNFTAIYLIWLIIFFAYSLFNLHTFHSLKSLFRRLAGAIALCIVSAIVYFYFQPELLLTPRRFLLVHVLLSGLGVFFWYWLLSKSSPKLSPKYVYAHESLTEEYDLEHVLSKYGFSGYLYKGKFLQEDMHKPENVLVVLPPKHLINNQTKQQLFSLLRSGIYFVEFPELQEQLTRTVNLSSLSELWFIFSVEYNTRRLFDIVKRVLDIIFIVFGLVVFLLTLPIIAILIKLTSTGSVFFSQQRVGQHGRHFMLLKYRTMKANGANNTWTEHGDKRITFFGRFLRATRLDELPQSLNILKGDMSIVGPRPEQVHIVEQLRQQIPYYDERHIVKPGLTGWAQLHVYASSVEETKRKLQYDLYYIKHRSLFFDTEIIMKTVYNIITLAGR